MTDRVQSERINTNRNYLSLELWILEYETTSVCQLTWFSLLAISIPSNTEKTEHYSAN